MPASLPPARRRLARFIRPLSLGLALAGCTNASEKFSGLWIAPDLVTLADGVEVHIELGVGHFGPELVGVLRLEDAYGAPLAGCDCAVIEGALVRPDAETFTAFAESPCQEGAAGSGRWALSLTLDAESEPRRLTGTLARADAPSLPVAFEALDAFVAPPLRDCP